MEALSCRLLPYEAATGPANMAADEVLAASAAEEDRPALRFYGWTVPTVSLGYFQPAAARLTEPGLAALPWVRRPSGGAMLVHHHELTYALAVPAGPAWRSTEPWLHRMHRLIARALGDMGVSTASGPTATPHSALCFLQHTPGDLLCAGHKMVGSAQRKYRQTLLQHGGILLAQSAYTPRLPGIEELTGRSLQPAELRRRIVDELTADTGWRILERPWTETELARRQSLEKDRYSAPSWNERR